eukprot:Skav212947  [mRNA]  locus=scaffold374:556322:557608:- [translate_table: standard]
MQKSSFALDACCKRRRVAGQPKGGFEIVETGLAQKLETLSPQIEEAYLPCQTSYLDAKGHWEISCYAELAKDVPDLMVPGAVEHMPLLAVLEPLLEEITSRLTRWWHSIHPEKIEFQLRRVQSFVTKYAAVHGKSHLTRHVDGPQVHASMILQLHSPKGFGGGGITVWDHSNVPYFYQLRAGDLCLLDHMVWHQSNEVTSGERWVLVVFCQEVLTKASTSQVSGCLAAQMTSQDAIALATAAADKRFLVEKSSVFSLMDMLQSVGSEERERAAFALGCLAANCLENRQVMMECGAAKLLADLLRKRIATTSGGCRTLERAWIVAALGRLASKSAINKSIIAGEGVIDQVVELVHRGNALEREEAISTLCNLAANHEANKDAIAATGVVRSLVQLLQGETNECIKERLWCMAALSNLAAGSVRFLDILM